MSPKEPSFASHLVIGKPTIFLMRLFHLDENRDDLEDSSANAVSVFTVRVHAIATRSAAAGRCFLRVQRDRNWSRGFGGGRHFRTGEKSCCR